MIETKICQCRAYGGEICAKVFIGQGVLCAYCVGGHMKDGGDHLQPPAAIERKDRMEIQFKSTIDVRLIQSMGGDHMIVAAAKVSTEELGLTLFSCL